MLFGDQTPYALLQAVLDAVLSSTDRADGASVAVTATGLPEMLGAATTDVAALDRLQQAIDFLRNASQRSNRKLRDVAEELVAAHEQAAAT